MAPLEHKCGVLAEPHYQYVVGGYHPVLLGDTFKDGRYKVLHKLGWGSFATVWAAKDLKNQEYVALKVSVAEVYGKSRERKVMHILTDLHSGENGSRHVMQFLDAFDVEGPNGKHECLVLEFMGPSVSSSIDPYVMDPKLPGPIAKAVMYQALEGLAYLHKHKIGHGDLHTNNLAFVIPSLHTLTEDEFFEKLGTPRTGPITRKDGEPLEVNKPPYLVAAASYRMDLSVAPQIKIIDFGESFPSTDVPDTLHTPVYLRAPEVIFGDKLDFRVDLWSAGCLIFELACGQPPIDSMFASPSSVAGDMLESTDDYLPERWHEKYRTIVGDWTGEKSDNHLQEWLEEIYFDNRKRQYFTRQDIVKIGKLVGMLLRFEPSMRASADEILRDPWFEDELSCELKLLKLHDGSGKSSSGNVSKPQAVPQVASLRPRFSQLSLGKGEVST